MKTLKKTGGIIPPKNIPGEVRILINPFIKSNDERQNQLAVGKNDKASFIIIETILFDIYIQLFDKKDSHVFHMNPRPLVKSWGNVFLIETKEIQAQEIWLFPAKGGCITD